ncbi:hypothetical protein [Nonomuraea zeae]|nr:hypothetical protein [Nonomuraea zeae]
MARPSSEKLFAWSYHEKFALIATSTAGSVSRNSMTVCPAV